MPAPLTPQRLFLTNGEDLEDLEGLCNTFNLTKNSNYQLLFLSERELVELVEEGI